MAGLVALYRSLVTARNKRRLEVSDFLEMLHRKGIITKSFGKRDAVTAFLLSRMLVVDEMRPPRVRTAGHSGVVCAPQDYHETLSFVDFLECVCRCADMSLRGERQGSLPWDEEKEGPEVKLVDVLDEFLEQHLLRNRKAMLKNAILKVQSLSAIAAPMRLQQLMEARQRR